MIFFLSFCSDSPSNSFSMGERTRNEVYISGISIGTKNKGVYSGIGVQFSDDAPYNISKHLSTGRQTHTRACIIAAIKALKKAKSGPKPIIIHVDNEYLFDAVTDYLPNLKKSNTKGAIRDPVGNSEDLQKLLSVIQDIGWNNIKWV